MSFPMQPILTRNFISTGAATTIALPNNAIKVELFDLTNITTVAGQTAGAETALYQKSFAIQGMPAGSGYSYTNTATTKTMVESLLATNGNGYTFLNTSLQTPGPAVATTAETAANPSVVSTASTAGLIAGTSIVRMINVTAMQQISSVDFTVGTIVANTSFGLKYLDASGFGAAGTNGFYRIIPNDPAFYPARRFITKITQAVNAVVTMSVTHGFTVGQLVRILVPPEFGMTQMNGQLATITAVTTGATNTITLNINSSGFTAFAFPTSAQAAAGINFAQVVPVGEAATTPFQNLLDDATINTGLIGVQLGTSVVGALGDNMQLIAYAGLGF
jgi:hypothetical protein